MRNPPWFCFHRRVAASNNNVAAGSSSIATTAINHRKVSLP
jgi:hypothetical protein